MSQVTITTSGSSLTVLSPYNPSFPGRAKALGGKWEAGRKAWVFDGRDEARVRELCQQVYGEGGTTDEQADLVTVRLRAAKEVSEWQEGLFCCGRQIASATGRDSGARLGGGVVLLAGRVDSGGSVKNWVTKATAGTEVEIKDLPRPALENMTAGWEVVEVTEQTPAAPDHDALVAEREKLVSRIAEIDALLA